VAVLVGVPHKHDEFKTNLIQFLTEKTLKGTFYGHYKPWTDIPGVVEQYLKGVYFFAPFLKQYLTAAFLLCESLVHIYKIAYLLLGAGIGEVRHTQCVFLRNKQGAHLISCLPDRAFVV
jgi:hypothetical protein